MASSSDRAELSTLSTQVEELTTRVVALAQRYEDTADSAIASELFAGERSLVAARRALERATTLMA
jgi:outer membrane murein-binding lipoprotein Lpp